MISRYRREVSVTAAYLALLAVLGLAAPRFYSSDEPRNIVLKCVPLLVTATGMTLVILARHIDISIGSQYSICGVVAGLLSRQGVPILAIAPITILAGAAMGAANGGLVAGLGLPSIVVTLATMVTFQEGLRLERQGEFVKNVSGDFYWFGLGQTMGLWLSAAVALGVLAAFAWGLRSISMGRAIYAVGSDPEAARLAGIRPRRVVFGVFVAMGALTGLAALLGSIKFPHVDPNMGKSLELQVIAAVVMGGAAVSGGRGTLAGSLVGVLLLSSIGSALAFMGIPTPWEKAVQGAIILVAVASDAFNLRQRRHAGASLAAR